MRIPPALRVSIDIEFNLPHATVQLLRQRRMRIVEPLKLLADTSPSISWSRSARCPRDNCYACQSPESGSSAPCHAATWRRSAYSPARWTRTAVHAPPPRTAVKHHRTETAADSSSPIRRRRPHSQHHRPTIRDLPMSKPRLVQRLAVDRHGLNIVVQMLSIQVLRHDPQRLAASKINIRFRKRRRANQVDVLPCIRIEAERIEDEPARHRTRIVVARDTAALVRERLLQQGLTTSAV